MGLSPRTNLLVVGFMYAVFGAISTVRLLGAGRHAWATVPVYAVVWGLLLGPVSWQVREHLSADQRSNLKYAGFAVAFFWAILIYGLLLAFQPAFLAPFLFFDGIVLGFVIAMAVVMVIESVIIPPALRMPELRALSES